MGNALVVHTASSSPVGELFCCVGTDHGIPPRSSSPEVLCCLPRGFVRGGNPEPVLSSVLSALFDARNPERQELTNEFFSRTDEHEAFVSELTRVEIEETPDEELRDKMRGVIADFHVLPSQEAVEQLPGEYVNQGAVSEEYPEDAYHIAVAVVNDLDTVLSWNFRHIVRRKTKDIVNMVNTMQNQRHVEISTPGKLL
jgi:predicted nucleic acid-binding protein